MYFLILIFWCFDGIVNTRTEQALILNINTGQLDDLTYYGDFTKCPVLTACPSSLPHEIQFNEQISISKNSLFIRNIHRSDHYAKDVPVDVCEKPIKPVVISNVISQEIEIGYELYYEERKISLQGKNHEWYKSTNLYKVNTGNGAKNTTQEFKLFVTKHQDRNRNQTRFTFVSGGSSFVFIFHWIPVLSMKSASDHQKCVPFLDAEIFKINKALTDKCSNYNAANEIVDSLYSEENQIKIWKPSSIPSSTSKTTINPSANFSNTIDNNINNTSISSSNITINSTNTFTTPIATSTSSKTTARNHPCGNPYGCLQQTQIIPLWYFRTNWAKLASCSYPNTAPIWKSIAERQIAKVDRYLFALARYITRDLRGEARLYFGISGVLKMKNPSNSNKSQEIRLSDPRHNLNIPVPKIVYRIVHCAVCVWLKTLIVIHNDPTPIPNSERLCSENREVEGWDDIKNTDYKTGFTYACLLTKEIDDMLGSQFLRSDIYRGFDGLNLKDFGYGWVEDEYQENEQMQVMAIPGVRIQSQDIRARVGREFENLSPNRRNV